MRSIETGAVLASHTFGPGGQSANQLPPGTFMLPKDSPQMQLKPCPDKPNCVGTEETNDKKRDALAFTGSAVDAQARLREIVSGMKRTTLVKEEDGYLHYTFKTWPIPFTDDVEFVIDDAAKVIRFRSASRVGHSDLGVNSKRMQKITDAWNDR